jgi:hypothetical protein
MKRRHTALMFTLVAAVWLVFFAGPTPDKSVVKAAERMQIAPAATVPQQLSLTPAMSAKSQPGAAKPIASDPVLLLQARQTLIGGAHDGAPTVLFGPQTWAPPPPPPAVVKPRPPPPPVAPPLPFTYLGKQFEDGKWQVFLARGDQTFIAVEQMIIDGLYRVDAIAPPQINLVYLPLQKMQTLSIGGAS